MKLDVIERYKGLKLRLHYLKEDIRYTETVLKDPKIDYVTKREYENDLITDHREIIKIGEELNELCDYMYQNKMFDEINATSSLDIENIAKTNH